MSVQTVTRQADLPSVNLIPPEIREARDFKRLQAGLAAVVVLSFVGVGIFWYEGRSSVQDARNSLASAQAQQAVAERQLHSLQYINASATDAATAQATLSQIRSADVHWSDMLTDLSLELPTNVWYTSVNIAETAKPGTYAVTADVPDAVGTVSFKAEGEMGQTDVADWLDTMTKIPYFANQTVSTSKEDGVSLPPQAPQVGFDSTVTVTKAAIAACDDPTGEC